MTCLLSVVAQMQHALTSKHNVSQQLEQRLVIHRSLRAKESGIQEDKVEQWATTVITQRIR